MDKSQEILRRQKALQRKVSAMQDDLYSRILEEYADEFTLDDKKLIYSAHNISLVRDVDDMVDELAVLALVLWLYREFTRMSEISFEIFTDRGFEPNKDILEMIQRQIGIKNGQIVSGGYLDSLSKQESVKLEIKSYVLRSIGEGKPYRQFLYGFRELIKGEGGVLQRYYHTFAHDVFAQVMRITDLQIAEELGLEHFTYEGGLIETSRQFCIKKDGMAFTRAEADEWRNDPDLPGRDSSFAYNPLIDLGRWNCRHYLNWITKEQYEEIAK